MNDKNKPKIERTVQNEFPFAVKKTEISAPPPPQKKEKAFFLRECRGFVGIQFLFEGGKIYTISQDWFGSLRRAIACLGVDEMHRPEGLDTCYKYGLINYSVGIKVRFQLETGSRRMPDAGELPNSPVQYVNFKGRQIPVTWLFVKNYNVTTDYPARLQNSSFEYGQIIPILDENEMLQLCNHPGFKEALTHLSARVLQFV